MVLVIDIWAIYVWALAYFQGSNMNSLKSKLERLVFVDPEDEQIAYWWPALIVPPEEYELFKETMDNDAGVNVGLDEQLVCYFEDGSFSVVPKSSLVPFNPRAEPFKSYSRRLKHFSTDDGVRRAVDFLNFGRIPKIFKWLILGEKGYLDPKFDENFDYYDAVEGEGKRRRNSAMTRRSKSSGSSSESVSKKNSKPKPKAASSLLNMQGTMKSSYGHDDIIRLEALLATAAAESELLELTDEKVPFIK